MTLNPNRRHAKSRLRPSTTIPNPRLILAAAAALVVAAIVASPILAHLARLEATAIYAAFSWFCHQQEQRCWWLLAHPLAVCVRCFGLYCGVFSQTVIGLPFSRRALYAAATLLAATWGIETMELLAVPSGVRFLSGLALGLTATAALVGKPPRASETRARTDVRPNREGHLAPARAAVAKPLRPQAN